MICSVRCSRRVVHRRLSSLSLALVSASLRDAVREAAHRLGIANVTIWSSSSEHLRLIGEDLLRRFCGGGAFRIGPDEIKTFADDFQAFATVRRLR